VEFDIQDGWAYLVTEYVEGETLEARIAREPGGLDEELVLKDMLDLTSLLEAITSQGYLFRDLKPQNIIIRPDGRPVLLDYGIAMSAEEANSLCELNYIDGSPHYVPPERLIGETEDARSEIYSLGMVMVHALTGRPYFQLSGKQAIAEAHVNAQRFSMTLVAPGITMELSELLDRMICRRKEDRIVSFAELRKALRMVATMTRRGPYFETTTQLIRLGDIAALRAGKSGKSQFHDKQREKTRKPGDK
jgi:serine/threonine protein kinase